MCKSEKLNSLENKFEELVQRMERMDTSWKMEKAHLEKKLETMNLEVENLESRMDEVMMLSTIPVQARKEANLVIDIEI